VADEAAMQALLAGRDSWEKFLSTLDPTATGPGAKHGPPDAAGADLRGAELDGAELARAELSESNLAGASLRGADLRWAELRNVDMTKSNLAGANLRGADLRGATLRAADLREANLESAALTGANLEAAELDMADLTRADLRGAILRSAHLERAGLRRADLRGANLRLAYLNRASLTGAELGAADLSEAWLVGADLHGAKCQSSVMLRARLRHASLADADLTGADLTDADLSAGNLVRASLASAKLRGCRVYGTAVWDVDLTGAVQSDLVASPEGQPDLVTDNIEVAQFLYLLLRNPKIRAVIDTITTKAVLILGGFSIERKTVLDALRETLRARGWVPIVFDFEPSQHRDTTETVSALAHLARFVIADLTDPRSVPQELTRIVPILPSLAVQPIILASQDPWSMFGDLRHYPWVLSPYRYHSLAGLLGALDTDVVAPAEAKARELTGPR